MRVTPPDLELWLTGYVRSLAASEAIQATVTNKEPADLSTPLVRPLIVIRDDSGSRLSHVTFDRSIGWSVLAGTRMNDQPANDLARWLAGVLFDLELPLVEGSPIASVEVDGCLGPYAVTEQLDVARRYGTAQYTVVGSW
ncbi:hypothetical protein [Microbacterium sp. CH-015]|uniref:hypothetical protein n=1 Tax=Microbacterium sp. CH-015 TaxID=3406734 RepID=UPI003C77F07D